MFYTVDVNDGIFVPNAEKWGIGNAGTCACGIVDVNLGVCGGFKCPLSIDWEFLFCFGFCFTQYTHCSIGSGILATQKQIKTLWDGAGARGYWGGGGRGG